ncbi:hypothetical protein [Microvirga sp. KLBC 81]|uniref:hypothetical protein n=1 Tax=Microvirga sp. KLBC 81 TaxID=1862707 RepID=UPI00105826B3|nr:hypothetical protein [Microvirga sp. KLBC 81]
MINESTITLKHASCPVLRAAALSALIMAACGIAQAQEPIQAIRLREIKNLDKLDPNWIMGLCNLPGLECNKVEEPKLYERKTATGAEYYAVMVNKTISRLVMRAPGQWEALNVWNLAKFPAPPKAEGAGDPRLLDIHPALYPVAPDLWAVAVLSNTSESYSGGGAAFKTADFVVLDSKASEVTEKQRLFAAVPFSCTKTVRACFSEKEYKKSPHCHDESTGFLALKFAPSSTGGLHDWTATWHETVWPGGVPKTAQTTTRTVAVLKPGKQAVAPGMFPFCGGPVDQ